MDQMLTLETKIDKIEEEAEEGSYDEEEDEDLGSELEDTLDVNDMPNKVGLGSHESSKHEIKAGDDADLRSELQDEESEMMEDS